MWHLVTLISHGLGSGSLVVGLKDLKGFFPPKQLNDTIILYIKLEGEELFQRQQQHLSTNAYVKMISKAPSKAFFSFKAGFCMKI